MEESQIEKNLAFLLTIRNSKEFLLKLDDYPELIKHPKLEKRIKSAKIRKEVNYLLSIDNPYELMQELNEYSYDMMIILANHSEVKKKLDSANKEIDAEVKEMDEWYDC